MAAQQDADVHNVFERIGHAFRELLRRASEVISRANKVNQPAPQTVVGVIDAAFPYGKEADGDQAGSADAIAMLSQLQCRFQQHASLHDISDALVAAGVCTADAALRGSRNHRWSLEARHRAGLWKRCVETSDLLTQPAEDESLLPSLEASAVETAYSAVLLDEAQASPSTPRGSPSTVLKSQGPDGTLDSVAWDVHRCRFRPYARGEGSRRLTAVLRAWQARQIRAGSSGLVYRQEMCVLAAVATHALAPVAGQDGSRSTDDATPLRGVGAVLSNVTDIWDDRGHSRRDEAVRQRAALYASLRGAARLLDAISTLFLAPCLLPSDVVAASPPASADGGSGGSTKAPALPLGRLAEVRRLSSFSAVLAWMDPPLAHALASAEIGPELYVAPALATLFADCAPLEKVLQLWDALVTHALPRRDARLPLFIAAAGLCQLRVPLLQALGHHIPDEPHRKSSQQQQQALWIGHTPPDITAVLQILSRYKAGEIDWIRARDVGLVAWDTAPLCVGQISVFSGRSGQHGAHHHHGAGHDDPASGASTHTWDGEREGDDGAGTTVAIQMSQTSTVKADASAAVLTSDMLLRAAIVCSGQAHGHYYGHGHEPSGQPQDLVVPCLLMPAAVRAFLTTGMGSMERIALQHHHNGHGHGSKAGRGTSGTGTAKRGSVVQDWVGLGTPAKATPAKQTPGVEDPALAASLLASEGPGSATEGESSEGELGPASLLLWELAVSSLFPVASVEAIATGVCRAPLDIAGRLLAVVSRRARDGPMLPAQLVGHLSPALVTGKAEVLLLDVTPWRALTAPHVTQLFLTRVEAWAAVQVCRGLLMASAASGCPPAVLTPLWRTLHARASLAGSLPAILSLLTDVLGSGVAAKAVATAAFSAVRSRLKLLSTPITGIISHQLASDVSGDTARMLHEAEASAVQAQTAHGAKHDAGTAGSVQLEKLLVQELAHGQGMLGYDGQDTASHSAVHAAVTSPTALQSLVMQSAALQLQLSQPCPSVATIPATSWRDHVKSSCPVVLQGLPAKGGPEMLRTVLLFVGHGPTVPASEKSGASAGGSGHGSASSHPPAVPLPFLRALRDVLWAAGVARAAVLAPWS